MNHTYILEYSDALASKCYDMLYGLSDKQDDSKVYEIICSFYDSLRGLSYMSVNPSSLLVCNGFQTLIALWSANRTIDPKEWNDVLYYILKKYRIALLDYHEEKYNILQEEINK